jgi:hypothetical protein
MYLMPVNGAVEFTREAHQLRLRTSPSTEQMRNVAGTLHPYYKDFISADELLKSKETPDHNVPGLSLYDRMMFKAAQVLEGRPKFKQRQNAVRQLTRKQSGSIPAYLGDLRGETLDNEMHVLYRLPQDTIDIRRSYPKHRWKSFEKKREAIAAAKEEETRVMDRSLEAITSADTLTAIKENRIFPDVRTTTDLEKLHTFDPSNGPALTQGEQVELYLSERDTHEERSLRRITSTPSMRNEVLKEAQKQGITYTRPNEFHGTSSQGVRSIEELRKLPSQLQKNIFHL